MGGGAEHLAVTPSNEIWLAGDQGGLWRGSHRRGWSFHQLPQGPKCERQYRWIHDVQAADDGSLWVARSDAVFRWNGKIFERVSGGAYSVWPKSAAETWLVTTEGNVRHHVNGEETPVQLDGAEHIDYLRARGNGEHVWLRGRKALWSLTAAGTPAPKVHVLERQMFKGGKPSASGSSPPG